jgi:putative transposase
MKEFVEGGIYHVYNRGIEKRNIFLDDHDYQHFLWIVDEFVKPDHPTPGNKFFLRRSVGKEISILSYCLMPNHFHFLIKLQTLSGITKLMQRICTVYATYFNDRYSHEGKVLQGPYKGARVGSDAYLMQVSAYIHRNPTGLCANLGEYKYSSYQDYLGKKKTSWLNTSEILDIFKTKNEKSPSENYRNYVEGTDFKNIDDSFKTISLDG